ncbi:flagellar basal body L-ring protein FlgH [Altererythrobacter sp. Z27]|uniref:flagellar basal body L-ring protein FlgH n=1 Tax=Altererythrobacter sp. Z27 TaxID=3461147 RepID=UPI004044A83B
MKAQSMLVLGGVLFFNATSASAEQLYSGNSWAGVAADIKARQVGDLLTIVINEAASATNRIGTRSSKGTTFGGGARVGGVDESLNFGFDSSYRGGGETERSDRFAASITAVVTQVFPNGELMVEGEQFLLVNGERRNIRLRGRVRHVDISPENMVLSNRLAGAEIQYDGKGFVSKSAEPGLINRIFSFLGIG